MKKFVPAPSGFVSRLRQLRFRRWHLLGLGGSSKTAGKICHCFPPGKVFVVRLAEGQSRKRIFGQNLFAGARKAAKL
jgi:hypothetical protein